MKNTILKTFFVFGVTLMSFGAFSSVNAQVGQAVFNNLPNDYPTVQVSNYTQNPGCNSCWSSSVSANPGDVVSVLIYYHNTSSVSAQNTKLKLNVLQNQESQYHNISGSLWATNANIVSGSASFNLTSAASLVFDNYVKWYPNQSIYNATNLPFGQNGNEIFSSTGLNIGNIGPDSPLGSFSAQGSIVVRFRVTNTSPAPVCVIDSFSANPTVVNYGSFSFLNWNTTNCSNISISGGGLNQTNLNTSGSISTGSLYANTTFTLSANGSNGLVTKSVIVNLNSQQLNCIIDSFSANPTVVNYGSFSSLNWNTTNCNYITIAGGGLNFTNQNPDGSISTGSLYNNITLTLTAQGNNTVQQSVSITVVGIPTNNCVVNSFYANPSSTLNYGGSTTLYWSTQNCNNVSISGGNLNLQNQNSNGSISTGSLYANTTFTLTAFGQNGGDSKQITINVQNQQIQTCSIISFTANPSQNVTYGNFSTLYWNTTNCSNISISGGGLNQTNLNTSGSISTGSLYANTTFTLSANGSNGLVSQVVYITVNNQPQQNCVINNFYASPNNIQYGNSTTLYWSTNNCSSVNISGGNINQNNLASNSSINTGALFGNTYYILTAFGQNGSTSSNLTVNVNNQPVSSCVINNFYATPSSVSYGQSATLYWSTQNCNSVSISNLGSYSSNGSINTGALYSNKYYTLTAFGQNGNPVANTNIFVINTPISGSLSVTTLGVQNVTRNSADIVGVLVYAGNLQTNTYFEWGTTSALGNQTTQSVFYSSSNTPFSKTLTGLLPDTLYFFRAVAENQNGRVEGDTRYFRTFGAQSPTSTNTIVYVSSSGESLVNLDLSSSFENVSIGESFDINIKYKNDSSITAKNSKLTITLPKNLVFQRISRGEYNKADHNVFANLEDISPKSEGDIVMQVRVLNKAENGELLVTVGTLSYDRGNKKEEVIDILTNKADSNGSVLGAFALGSGFLPSTLLGWLILIGVFMLILYIINKMFKRKNEIVQPINVPIPPQNYR